MLFFLPDLLFLPYLLLFFIIFIYIYILLFYIYIILYSLYIIYIYILLLRDIFKFWLATSRFDFGVFQNEFGQDQVQKVESMVLDMIAEASPVGRETARSDSLASLEQLITLPGEVYPEVRQTSFCVRTKMFNLFVLCRGVWKDFFPIIDIDHYRHVSPCRNIDTSASNS